MELQVVRERVFFFILRTWLFALLLAGCLFWALKVPVVSGSVLRSVIQDSERNEVYRAQDYFQRPFDVLYGVFGVRPGIAVLEVSPDGYYREILNSYYDKVPGSYRGLTLANAMVDDHQYDLLLTVNDLHADYATVGLKAMFEQYAKLTKPGGHLGIIQYRAWDGTNLDDVENKGYMPESVVIEAAEAAGFHLVMLSGLLYNERDTHDHPQGAFSLPPFSSQAEALDVGVPDRMALYFKGPA